MKRLDNPVAVSRIKDLTEEHIRYFRDNPEMLDLISDREDFHFFRYFAMFVGAVLLVAASKVIAFNYADRVSQLVNTVVIDLVFEMGAALIGSVATVMFLGLQQKRQFERNLRLRIEIERRIEMLNAPRSGPAP